MAKRAMLSSAITAMATKIWSSRKDACERMMKMPSPSFAATHSPMTAPMTA